MTPLRLWWKYTWKRLRRRWQVWGIGLGLGLLRRFPFSVACALGRELGGLAFFFLSRERRMGRRNLRIAFRGQLSLAEESQILFHMFRHYGELIAENVHLPQLSPQERERMVVNLEEVRRKFLSLYRQHGRLILATAHLGNWELMGSVAAQHVPMAVVARRPFHPTLHQWMVQFRSALGMETIDSRTGLKDMLRKLRQGYALGLLLDQHLKRMAGRPIPFFGTPAHTITGPISLSIATKAPIVPAFTARIGPARHVIYLGDPLSAPSGLSREEQVAFLLTQWSRALEECICRHPHQWCWNHNRWRDYRGPVPPPIGERISPKSSDAMPRRLGRVAQGEGCDRPE